MYFIASLTLIALEVSHKLQYNKLIRRKVFMIGVEQ